MAKFNWNENWLRSKTWISESMGGGGYRVASVKAQAHLRPELRGIKLVDNGIDPKSGVPIKKAIYDAELKEKGLIRICHQILEYYSVNNLPEDEIRNIVIQMHNDAKKFMNTENADRIYGYYMYLINTKKILPI